MFELYFILYRVPKMMSRLARERNRGAVAWSLMGIAAWLGAELVVMLSSGIIYALGSIFLGRLGAGEDGTGPRGARGRAGGRHARQPHPQLEITLSSGLAGHLFDPAAAAPGVQVRMHL